MTLEFCSMSIDKSRKDSSLDETVSQVRQRVSLVKTPSNKRCTRVDAKEVGTTEVGAVLGTKLEGRVAIDRDTGGKPTG